MIDESLPSIDEPLPPLQEALLDEGTLRQLFFDLEAVELLDVRLRAMTEGRGTATEVSLAQALLALVEHATSAAQLRYRYGGSEWIDSLMVVPGGFRLVRIEHAAPRRSARCVRTPGPGAL